MIARTTASEACFSDAICSGSLPASSFCWAPSGYAASKQRTIASDACFAAAKWIGRLPRSFFVLHASG